MSMKCVCLLRLKSLLRNYFSDQGNGKIPFERELCKTGMPIEISVETLIGENSEVINITIY